MENRKSIAWDERHPFGNLSYHTFLMSFEGVSSLEKQQRKSLSEH